MGAIGHLAVGSCLSRKVASIVSISESDLSFKVRQPFKPITFHNTSSYELKFTFSRTPSLPKSNLGLELELGLGLGINRDMQQNIGCMFYPVFRPLWL